MTETTAIPTEAEAIELNLSGRKLTLRMNGNVLELSAQCDIAIRSAPPATISVYSAHAIRIGLRTMPIANARNGSLAVRRLARASPSSG